MRFMRAPLMRGIVSRPPFPRIRSRTRAAKRFPLCRIQACFDLLCSGRAVVSTGRQGRLVMAKGQMRSNKEKKKPKQDKNLKKGGAAPSPFASGKSQASPYPGKKG